jgi:hypothetical protein
VDPLDHEAGLLVSPLGPWIEGEDPEFDPVQPELLEPVADDQPGRLGPEPTPLPTRPDQDPEVAGLTSGSSIAAFSAS